MSHLSSGGGQSTSAIENGFKRAEGGGRGDADDALCAPPEGEYRPVHTTLLRQKLVQAARARHVRKVPLAEKTNGNQK